MGKRRKRGMGIATGKSNLTAPCPKVIDAYFQGQLRYVKESKHFDNSFYALYTKNLNNQDNPVLPELAGVTCNSQIIVDLYTGAIVDDYLKVNKKKISTFAECENDSIKTIFKWHANIIQITCEYIKYGWLEKYSIKKELETAKSKGKILNKTDTRNLLIKTMPLEINSFHNCDRNLISKNYHDEVGIIETMQYCAICGRIKNYEAYGQDVIINYEPEDYNYERLNLKSGEKNG